MVSGSWLGVLILVAVWILLMPFPSALDNGVKRLELWSPAKLVFNFFRGSDKARRIAGSARLFNRMDLSPGDFAASRDYLPNTRAASRAEVIESAGGCAKRQNVRAREIDNMNVVTNTRPVGRLIISAVNFNIRYFAKRDLQHRGNQMRLRPMIFAEVLCGAGRVEVAQTNELQPMYLVVPA